MTPLHVHLCSDSLTARDASSLTCHRHYMIGEGFFVVVVVVVVGFFLGGG